MKKKGFTLIELLAIIVILGLIVGIAIFGISKYLDSSRKKIYVKVAQSYIDSVRNKVNNGEYTLTNTTSVYYIPLSCIELENGGNSPYGKFKKGYVVVTFDGSDTEYRFYAKDEKGYGIENIEEKNISITSIKSNAKEVNFELVNDKEVIESMDENTCSTALVMQDIPYTSEECFEVEGNVITKYNNTNEKCGKVISIPKEINGVKIEEIGPNSFTLKEITVLKLSDNIKRIGDNSFFGNKLTSIELSDNITYIGQSAFTSNELYTVKLSSNLKEIKDSAFAYNNLKEIKIPDSVTAIGESAFLDNNLETVQLPTNLVKIGYKAFTSNKLIDINIPKSVTYIGAGAFNDNLLEKDQFIYKRNDDGTIDYTTIVSYAGKERKNVIVPEENNGIKLKVLAESSFYASNIENIKIPNSVEEIGKWALSYNSLKSIDLPTKLKKIGARALSVNDLTELKLPDTIEELGGSFIDQTKIKKISIPNSIKYIDAKAFVEYEDEEKIIEEIVIDKRKEELDGYPFGLVSDYNRIKFLR